MEETSGEIGGFRRIKVIGSGAQGKVWKARCVKDVHGIVPKGAVVALKIRYANSSDADALWDSLRPRVTDLVRMNHPNVVRYLGCFRERDTGQERLVVVQECLEGETLKERLAKRRIGLDVDECLRIVTAAADGLDYISGLNIVHRDIKPGNIFLCEDGSVKLIDFGVARQDGGTVDSASNIRGTYNYLAPDFLMDETFHGDAQSDIFSLGVMFHEILTGELPYKDSSASDVQGWIYRWTKWKNDAGTGDPVLSVQALARRLLTNVDPVLKRSLAPDRSLRYADFTAFKKDLAGIGFVEQQHAGRTYRRLQFVGKGGFGEVFKARWQEKGVDVAVKQLLNTDYAVRFRTEARVMQELHDSCFVEFIDFFETDETAFLVMRFLDGMPGNSLRDAITKAGENGLPKNLVLPAFERYARGLALMHRRGIIHRDIKPANLYYPVGRPDRVAIMDLGIVRTNHSTCGTLPCTFAYAPPELALSNDRGTPGMDIYALGLCMYEALTGQDAFPRDATGTSGLVAFFDRAKKMCVPDFSDPRIAGDPDLQTLLRRMTEPDLALRCQSADEVAQELRRLFYRKDNSDACPPTQIFDAEIDQTRPIDEGMLMDWYQQWIKVHPEAQEAPVVESGAATSARRRSRWPTVLVVLSVLIALSGGGVYWFVAGRQVVPLPPLEPQPSLPDPSPLRQAFERTFDNSLGDEPVGTRRQRLATARLELQKVAEQNLYSAAELARFESQIRIAEETTVGKVVNCCQENLNVAGVWLEKDSSRVFRFMADDTNRFVRLMGCEPLPLAADFDGKELAITVADFDMSFVSVSVPHLETGVDCFFAGKKVTDTLALKPGKYTCDYRREGYQNQTRNFEVYRGRSCELPSPAPDEWSETKERVDRRNQIKKIYGEAFSIEPLAGRQERLSHAKQALHTARAERLFKDSDLAEFEANVADEARCFVCVISNGCGQVLTVAGQKLAVGARRAFRFEPAEVQNQEMKLPNYEPLKFSNEFNGREQPVTVADFVPLPVEVSVPVLAEDVSCVFASKKRKSGEVLSSVEPGDYKCIYERPGFRQQTIPCTIAAGKSFTLPLPGEWVSETRKAPSPVSVKVPKSVEDAEFYYTADQYGMVVECLYQAYGDGWKLRAQDWRILDDSFSRQNEFLKNEIARLERQTFRQKENHRDIANYKAEQKKLLEQYRAITASK